MTDHVLDARDMICPMPVLKAGRALKALSAGAVLEVLATDPAAPADFRSFCAHTGHRLLAEEARPDGVTVLRIEKAGNAV